MVLFKAVYFLVLESLSAQCWSVCALMKAALLSGSDPSGALKMESLLVRITIRQPLRGGDLPPAAACSMNRSPHFTYFTHWSVAAADKINC